MILGDKFVWPKAWNLMTPNEKVAIFLAESVGTGLLMYVGCFAVAMNIFDSSNFPPYFGGVVFGLTVLVVIQIFGHISGAHINPTVTLAAVFLGYVRPSYVSIYIIAQFVGAILGFLMIKGSLPIEFTNPETFNNTIKISGVCCTVPHEKISIMQALLIESIATGVLILLCCSVWDKRNAKHTDSVPLRFGLAVAGLSITFGGLTGCSMNTARSFAPAFVNWEWTAHWIYWVGPNIGGLIAVVFYKMFFGSSKNNVENVDQVCSN